MAYLPTGAFRGVVFGARSYFTYLRAPGVTPPPSAPPPVVKGWALQFILLLNRPIFSKRKFAPGLPFVEMKLNLPL